MPTIIDEKFSSRRNLVSSKSTSLHLPGEKPCDDGETFLAEARDWLIRIVVASAWALLVGGLMGIGWWSVGAPVSEALISGVLGGAGAAIFILFFAADFLQDRSS